MTYTAYDGSQLEQTLQRLQQRVSSIASDLDELQDRHRDLDTSVDEVDNRVDALETVQQELREAHDDLQEGIDDDIARIAATVKALAATVGWMERRLRAEHDIAAAPLDAVDDNLRQLADRARRGQQSAAVLLSQPVRMAHQSRIDQLGELERNIEQDTALALQLSATLANRPRGSIEYREAGDAYRAAAKRLTGYRGRLPATRQAADDARRALNLDDKHREVHGPQVMTGEAARARLRDVLRARLDTAVAEGALLPPWLTLVLGHQPLAEDVAAWIELATSLLAYRVTYQVTDPVVALGADGHDDPHRQAWHHKLDQQLRDRRRWPA
ncbi:hypothetical protein [Krasilnikovia sp. M28-CT-15]|uniref:hypothetical protein n=1 Tax=Krasilnikovia sp. M28-CT-15 TaxID=3373540 RepID=UPI00387775EB